MAKTYKEWVLKIGSIKAIRNLNGYVTLSTGTFKIVFTPAEIRRLAQKLSGDYRD